MPDKSQSVHTKVVQQMFKKGVPSMKKPYKALIEHCCQQFKNDELRPLVELLLYAFVYILGIKTGVGKKQGKVVKKLNKMSSKAMSKFNCKFASDKIVNYKKSYLQTIAGYMIKLLFAILYLNKPMEESGKEESELVELNDIWGNLALLWTNKFREESKGLFLSQDVPSHFGLLLTGLFSTNLYYFKKQPKLMDWIEEYIHSITNGISQDDPKKAIEYLFNVITSSEISTVDMRQDLYNVLLPTIKHGKIYFLVEGKVPPLKDCSNMILSKEEIKDTYRKCKDNAKPLSDESVLDLDCYLLTASDSSSNIAGINPPAFEDIFSNSSDDEYLLKTI